MGSILGGSPFGRNDALVDTTRAVLVDRVDVCTVAGLRSDGVELVIALEFGGRINKTTRRSEQLYLVNADGAAGIISELLGVAGRADPAFLAQLLQRISDLPKQPSTTDTRQES